MTLLPQIVPEHYQMLATVLSHHTESSVSTSYINIFRGLPSARKVDVSVRTPEFCLCWLDVTDPFQADGESRFKPFRGFVAVCKTEISFGLMTLSQMFIRLVFISLNWTDQVGFSDKLGSTWRNVWMGKVMGKKSRHFELMWGLFLLTVHLCAYIIVSVRDGDEWCVRL